MSSSKGPFLNLASKHILIKPRGVKRPKDFELPEKFPFCCGHHEQVFKDIREHLPEIPKIFPWITSHFKNKEAFTDFLQETGEWVISKLVYTECIIENNIDDEDWYGIITEYFLEVYLSFESPKLCWHIYEFHLRHYINTSTQPISREKRKSLTDYLDKHFVPLEKQTEPADLNELYQIYQDWLQTFPFDLEMFKKVHPLLAKRMPLLRTDPLPNRYSPRTMAKMHSVQSLAEALFEWTKSLLKWVDFKKLVNEGVIKDFNASLKAASEKELELKQKILFNELRTGEKPTVSLITNWLQDINKHFERLVIAYPTGLPKKEKPADNTGEKLKPQNFGFIFTKPSFEKKKNALLKAITQLHLEIDLLKEQTTPEQLVEVLLADDLSKKLPEIHFDIKTTEIAYFRKVFGEAFKNFRPSSISASGLFYSKMGNVIKENNLYKSKVDNPTNQSAIDSTFAVFTQNS